MTGAGVVSNRGNTFNAFQYFYQGLYASSIDVGILDVDIMTVGNLTVTTAAVSLASVGALYGGSGNFTGALSAGSVATASANVSLATLGATYASSLNVSGATVLTGGATLGTPLGVPSGGTGLASVTAGYIPYGNGTSALSTSASLTTDGTKIHVGTASAFTGNYLYQLNNTDSALLVRQDGSAPIQTWNAGGAIRGTLTSTGRLLIGATAGTLPTAGSIGLLVSGSADAFMEFHNGTSEFLAAVGAGTDSLQFYTGSGAIGSESYTQRMVITSTGYVGIGTVTPGFALELVGATFRHSGTQYDVLPGVSTNFEFVNRNGAGFDWYVNAASSAGMRLSSSSDLSIGGLHSALGKLDVRATSGAQFVASYDASNYLSTTVNSTGYTVLNAQGSASGIDLSVGASTKVTVDSTDTRFYNSNFRIDQAPAGSAGAATGTYLTLNLNGTDYKIALLANA